MTDISVEGVMERGVLPPNLTDNTKVVLPAGRYPVQVLIFFLFPAVMCDADPDPDLTLPSYNHVGKSASRVCRSKSGAGKMIRIHNTGSQV